jgi:uncharacterized protein (TIGR03435 family)
MSSRSGLLETAVIVVLICSVLSRSPAARVAAQSPAVNRGARPAFEIASIKPNHSGEMGSRTGTRPGGLFIATNVSLKAMIMQAYNLQDFQVSGGPGWIDSDRFDVSAKAESDVPEEQIMLMLRLLLEKRFQLKAHRDTRERGIYALVVATNGPKLKKAEGTGYSFGVGGRKLTAQRASLSDLANILSIQLGRTVLDKTGLTDLYDITLSWAPTPGTSAESSRPPADEAAASIFTAIQEQLGLRLEPSRGPVELLIIDGAQKPVEGS